MKQYAVLFVCILAAPVRAELYKCTAADGSVEFSDTPCRTARQEEVELSFTPAPNAAKEDESPSRAETPSPAAAGRKVTSASPLAKVYKAYVAAVKNCDRAGIVRTSSAALGERIQALGDDEFDEACEGLQMFLPGDFRDATVLIDGDRATMTWKDEKITYEGNGRSRISSEVNAKFTKEDGQWKVGG